jgi:hypothetical protein
MLKREALNSYRLVRVLPVPRMTRLRGIAQQGDGPCQASQPNETLAKTSVRVRD